MLPVLVPIGAVLWLTGIAVGTLDAITPRLTGIRQPPRWSCSTMAPAPTDRSSRSASSPTDSVADTHDGPEAR